MPFFKDTSYRDMPFSPESPSPEDFYCFVSVKQLIEQMKNDLKVHRCRTIGVVACEYDKYVIHELDDNTVQIRLSLAHMGRLPPFAAKPYAAQLFGVVQWKDGVGLVMSPYVLQNIPAAIAVRMRDSMERMALAHVAQRTKEVRAVE